MLAVTLCDDRLEIVSSFECLKCFVATDGAVVEGITFLFTKLDLPGVCPLRIIGKPRSIDTS